MGRADGSRAVLLTGMRRLGTGADGVETHRVESEGCEVWMLGLVKSMSSCRLWDLEDTRLNLHLVRIKLCSLCRL